MSIFGRAYEYVIRNQDDEVRLYKSDPRNTFVIYDNTIEQNSLVAVRYWQTSTREYDDTDIYNVDIITPNATNFFYANKSTNLSLQERRPSEPHSFGKVTITEFSNNEKRRGTLRKLFR